MDYLKHTQNSFRPSTSTLEPSPYSNYQYACRGDSLAQISDCRPFDIKDSSITTTTETSGANPGGGYITMVMHLNGNVPAVGSEITAIPAPFSSINFEFFFATSAQERVLSIGINCSGADTPESPANTDDLTVANTGAKIVYSGISATSTCPKAANAIDEAKGINSDGQQAVTNRSDVLVPVHPLKDGWLAVVGLETIVVADGAPRQDGSGTVNCANNATTCIDYDLQLGDYEGYSGFQETQDKRDLEPKSQAATTFSIVGNTVTVKIPYAPQVIGSPDGDLLLDDARVWPWPFKTLATDKVTNFVAETSGVVQAGANTVDQVRAVCPDNSYNILPEASEPLKTVGKTIGDANVLIEQQTRGSDPDDDVTTDPAGAIKHTLFDDPDTEPEEGLWVIGVGGNDPGDCIRGIYGLITVLDWLRDGFQLRLYPRQPGYLPSATSVNCRYPIGHFPAAPAPVTMEQAFVGPITPPTVGVSTSPFDKPWRVDVYANGDKLSPPSPVNGPVLPAVSQSVSPGAGTIGKNQACGYQFHSPGLHYFDILPDFLM